VTDAPLAAAVDLGSNSFHLVVARLDGAGTPQVLDRVKRTVRLAAGLNADGHLSTEAQERALDCLRLFGQRLRDVPPERVRAVGTNTLRKARNALDFLARARRALGHRVDIIAGREEARLIYRGVAQDLESTGRRLVVDIGGGSTEVIVGEGLEPRVLDSLHMGCVGYSLRFFPEGDLTREAFRRAVTAARLELETVEGQFKAEGWSTAVGSSGTITSIEKILQETGLSPDGITPRGLRRLRAACLEAGQLGRLQLSGLTESRREVLPGGLAILLAVLDALEVPHLATSESALREGVLYELLGRMRHQDTREETVARVAATRRVDTAQAARVESTALRLFDSVATAWSLEPGRHRAWLSWAARLHEVGIDLNFSSYHKHGAYLLEHGDFPGFTRAEQVAVAALVLGHRGRLDPEKLATLYKGRITPLLRLAVLLRLAHRLHRSRAADALPAFALSARSRRLTLTLPEAWLSAHPLTAADLDEEAAAIAPAGLRLRVRRKG
jgi:exopolyphosphatase/guanosine-5'-triphosphate,3'-diphosphate pyrophosphatase